jgi:tRNA threonylcarbamoyl adenosine modification protein (Sua5/YciO/YrdC/YwlC family)
MMRRWTIRATPSSEQVREISATLANGGLVLMPTDTIYGLHALARDAHAIDRLAGIKGRDANPFVVIANSLDQIQSIGAILSPSNRNALESLWPAPLTAVVPLRESIAASRGAATVAVRVPDLAWLRDLLALTGPLASTSANVSGAAPASSPAELSPDLLASLDGIVDAGSISGKPSAIIDFTGDEPRLIRAGEDLFTQKVWKTLRKSL